VKGAPGAPEPGGPTARTLHLAHEYLRYRYTDHFVHFWKHLRGLPGEESRVTHAALALAALVVVGTPLLVVFEPRLATFAFEDVEGTRQTLSVAGLALALLAFSVGWGYVLAAGAESPAWLWPLITVQYVYLVVLLGLTIGRSYLHLFAIALPVAVGAVTPGTNAWAQLVVAVALGSVAAHLTPLATWLAIRWYVVWPFLAAAFLWLSRALARRPWPSVSARLCLAAGGTALYVAAIAVLARRPGPVTSSLNISLNEAFALLALLWFLLGASFVEGAISLAQFARRGLESVAPERWLDGVIAAGWVALCAWTIGHPLAATSRAAAWWPAAALAALAAVLLVRWRRGIDRDWLAGWFVASVAAVLALRAYATYDLRGLMTGNLGLLSIAAFLYGITWEIVSEIRHVPLEASGFRRPSPLLFFLGAVLLIEAASVFGLASHLVVFQQEIVLNEYDGVVALCVPIALLAAVRSWRLLSPAAVRRCQHAFGIGALLAVPAFVLRAALPFPATDAAIVAAVAALAMALVLRAPDLGGHLAVAALGCATALGFAVSLAQRVIVDAVVDLLNMLGALSGVHASRDAAVQIRDWSQRAAEQPPGHVLYYLAVAAAVAAALALGAARPRRDPVPAPADGGAA